MKQTELRFLVHGLLALCLLVGTQGAALHALSHLEDGKTGTSQGDTPERSVCHQCLGYHNLDGALTSDSPALGALEFDRLFSTVIPNSVLVRFRLHYQIRAPPRLA
jgi:hypothetical protein